MEDSHSMIINGKVFPEVRLFWQGDEERPGGTGASKRRVEVGRATGKKKGVVSGGGRGKQTCRKTPIRCFLTSSAPSESETLVRTRSLSVSPENSHSQDGTVPAQMALWMLVTPKKPSISSPWGLHWKPEIHRWALIKKMREKTESKNKAFLNLLKSDNTFETSKQKRYCWEDDF